MRVSGSYKRDKVTRKTGLACARHTRGRARRHPNQYQPCGWLKSGYWSISLDRPSGLWQPSRFWMPHRRRPGCPPHAFVVGTSGSQAEDKSSSSRRPLRIFRLTTDQESHTASHSLTGQEYTTPSQGQKQAPAPAAETTDHQDTKAPRRCRSSAPRPRRSNRRSVGCP